MDIEIWKKCGETSLRNYEVSNYGNVRSLTMVNNVVRNLKPYEHTSGYLGVSIDGKRRMIAHIVAREFIGERPQGFVVDHIDRNRYNNRYDNLRYCSSLLNSLNSSKQGEGIPYPRKEVERHRQQSKKRLANKFQCECGIMTNQTHQSRHRKSNRHLKLLNKI
jgi:hypothetical protein